MKWSIRIFPLLYFLAEYKYIWGNFKALKCIGSYQIENVEIQSQESGQFYINQTGYPKNVVVFIIFLNWIDLIFPVVLQVFSEDLSKVFPLNV